MCRGHIVDASLSNNSSQGQSIDQLVAMFGLSGTNTACKPALGSTLASERSRCLSVATLCHSHLKQLSKLTDALAESTFKTSQHGEAGELLQVADQVSSLHRQWAADDAVAEAAQREAAENTSMKKGMRMLKDALEIDFSRYEDSEDEEEDQHDLPKVKRLPREVRYFDTARIHVKAGDGGTGCCAFRREKFVSHGGPAGGNGGNGGSVWAIAEEGMNSLLPFRNSVHWKAKAGVNGGGKDMHGANAQDLYIKVPPGIIIRHIDAHEDEPPLAELLHSGMSPTAPELSPRSSCPQKQVSRNRCCSTVAHIASKVRFSIYDKPGMNWSYLCKLACWS